VLDVANRSDMRWVVDTPNDLDFVRRVYDRLFPYGPAFSRNDVFELLEESPELSAINAGIETPSLRPMHRVAA
jgi:spore coat polysaccharide biosynthesis protein SpsF (cytidylyltransferase family)